MRLLLALLCASLLRATPTNIVDVLLQPSGNPQTAVAGMDITISQTAFVSGNNYYPGFTLTPHPVSDSAGNVNLWLEPNVTGQLYQVLFRATNGVITRECWNVPSSNAALRIKDVRSTVCNTTPGITAAWGQLTGVNTGLAAGAYSAYMPNPTYPPAYLINSASTGDVDLYTVPANRKALLLGWVVTLPQFSSTVNNYLETKIGGAYYRISNTASTSGGSIGLDQTATVDMLPRVLNAGETASVNMDTAGLSTWLHLIEFDASSPLRSVTLTAFGTGQNTLYMVPTGKTFEVLPLYARLPSNLFSSLRAYLFFSNGTNTTLGLMLHAVPNGGSVSVNNALAGVANLSGGAVSSTGVFSGSLAPGDFLSVSTGTNASGQMAWMNIIEH